jgi:hypothetical protein
LLGRKSVLMGMAASMGFVFGKATKQSPPPTEGGDQERKSNVVVGPGGDYTTLAALFADYPTGNVDIYISATSLIVPDTIRVQGVKNVSITGRGPFGGTKITTTAGFISASGDSDCWAITNLFIEHAPGANTDDGIVVDYPRRWSVSKCTLSGFGGSSVRYGGGLHSEIQFNYIVARDTAGAHGLAGIRIGKSTAGIEPSTIRTEGNYIGAGIQYGILAEYVSQGIFAGDIAEYCKVGMRFKQCSGELTVPYTEGITGNDIELFDSILACVGTFRVEPKILWQNTKVADRYIVRIGRNWVNAGVAIVFGGSTGGSDPTTHPSIRWGTGSPEGMEIGVVGSTWSRTDGGAGTSFYVKESGAGNTGWIAK